MEWVLGYVKKFLSEYQELMLDVVKNEELLDYIVWCECEILVEDVLN